MNIELFEYSQDKLVIDLFTKVFTDSEGKAEGQLISDLVTDLIKTTPSKDLIGFVALSDNQILGSIFFSSFFLTTGETAFILSPVAIATAEQGKGIGQQLINFGIEYLKANDVKLIFTYGDPNFYSKVGFHQISESVVKAPLTLSFPEGWLAQSINGQKIEVKKGDTQCVTALYDQKYW